MGCLGASYVQIQFLLLTAHARKAKDLKILDSRRRAKHVTRSSKRVKTQTLPHRRAHFLLCVVVVSRRCGCTTVLLVCSTQVACSACLVFILSRSTAHEGCEGQEMNTVESIRF
jgi:hypothetical protein